MEQRSPRFRFLLIFCLAVVWMGAVLARLTYLQLFSYQEYLTRANRQQERIIEISPVRGVIYDRNGRELAMSIPVDSCFADPEEISDPEMVARLLSRILNKSEEEIEEHLKSSRSFAWIARKITPQQRARIEALNLRGVYFQKENKRFYPEHDLAASVLGYVDVDEHGLGGVEYSLDKLIRGQPSRMLVMADARQRWFDRSENTGDKGDNVVLTIDQTIQFIAEKALAAGIERTHAKGGSVVVQDPITGELLAVADWPTFDPNDPRDYHPADRVERAVADAYEPGSIFKTILLSAAIEEGVARPNELVDCQMGSIVVAGRLIHDWKPYGVLSVEQVLVHSSDVGAIKVALRLGAPKYYEYMRDFGFGQLTGIKLPGENRGILRPLEDWTPSSIGSLAIGQEISVTPVQMVSAESAIANGGILRKPEIIRKVLHGGEVVMQGDQELRRVISESTAATIRDIMEHVMIDKGGTGKPGQPLGYTAAGKTGTAQKIDPATGRYSKTNYEDSFIGFAPVNNPVVTILVNLDSPVGEHHGGQTAGPVFREVAEQTLAYLNVPHDMPEPPTLEMASLRKQGLALPRQTLAGSYRASRRSSHPFTQMHEATVPESSTVAIAEGQAVTVPKLVGQTVRGVTETCLHLGLMPILIGDGIATDQIPDAGTRVLPGTKVTVHFGQGGDTASTRPGTSR